MKKKLAAMALILVVASGSVFAKGLDFQFGAGYNGYFYGEDNAAGDYALGFAAFGGVGYKFFPTLSVGAEYEYSMTWNLTDALSAAGSSLYLREHLPKAYIKFNAMNILALTGLIGADISTPVLDGASLSTQTDFTLGARIAFLFAYAQYMMVFKEDRLDSRVSVGVVFSK